MTVSDVQRIFHNFIEGDDIIRISASQTVTIDSFLSVAGFAKAPNNPTKEDLLAIDCGVKGYADLIESGNYS